MICAPCRTDADNGVSNHACTVATCSCQHRSQNRENYEVAK
jgi:hypothetical protein